MNQKVVLHLAQDHDKNYINKRELQESERKYSRIFELSMDGLILWNDDYRIVDINSMASKMLGMTKDKLMGHAILDLFESHRENQQEIIRHIEQVIHCGDFVSSIKIETKDGIEKYFDVSTKRGMVDGINFTIIKDVTEAAKMQEQLRNSDRLNVIGELAAGIAHEIRNPMTALKGFIQLLEGSIKSEHAMYYEVITSELARIDSIINEFLILSKPKVIRFQEINVNQIMKETLDLLSAQAVLYNVQFTANYESHLPYLYCEPNQLKKVFINIIKNAIEGMPEGGEITITLKKDEKNQIIISIQDEGIGMPKDKLKKLGEPFYTTKERGTGLGLMVSFKIIDEHKGNIKVESEEGKGTTFHLTLPLGLDRLIV
ncbi:ATP-binding protein [Neobacillus sp. FSL H8-0543]|uniref:PAS domain-containing sensor histidine kinase n=1 Tax=Neobacillus sp. FSL H8-0543 TaxID=2954672 RepID=UPI003157FAB2